MASDVMSLFGLDPQILQSQRAQAGVDQASRMSADYAVGAAGGTMLGAGLNTMLGLQTPEMQQAAQVQQSLAGVDINDAAGLRRAASQLMANGQYAQAMTLYQQARELDQASAEELRTQQTHEMGNTVQVTVGQEWDQLNQKWVAQKNTVTFFGDGSVEDATLGKKFDSRAEWLEAVQSGKTEEDSGDTVRTPEEVLKLAATAKEAETRTTYLNEQVAALQKVVDSQPTGAAKWAEDKIKEYQEEIAELQGQ